MQIRTRLTLFLSMIIFFLASNPSLSIGIFLFDGAKLGDDENSPDDFIDYCCDRIIIRNSIIVGWK